jgi:hypothetical protein
LSIEERWIKMEVILKESAEEATGERKREINKEWFDEECKEAILQKNTVRKKMIQKETRTNCEKYKELRKKCK